jgi:hypothetical protein
MLRLLSCNLGILTLDGLCRACHSKAQPKNLIVATGIKGELLRWRLCGFGCGYRSMLIANSAQPFLHVSRHDFIEHFFAVRYGLIDYLWLFDVRNSPFHGAMQRLHDGLQMLI